MDGVAAGVRREEITDVERAPLSLGVLGPIVGRRDGLELSLGGPKQQTVLAMLIAHAPGAVSADRIAEAVYGEDVPERGRRRVQTYVSTLRSMVGDAIVRRGDGWALDLDRGAVDSTRFEDALADVGRLRFDDASNALGEALDLWRGSPYAGIEAHGHLDAEIRRLEELRLHGLERRIDADLDAGRSADVVPELAALVAEHPYRESLRARHMLALYRAGRQQEALASFAELRTLLIEDLGVDPTPELRDLERRILQQDDRLVPEAEPAGLPLRGYRLLERIGSGAFAIVWRGIQPSVQREVAVKQIRGELTSRPEFIRRFEAEAQLVARIEHPHVVPLIDYWRDPDGAYLVMRWLRGGTVERSLDDGPWDLARTLRLAGQIGDALGEAHRRGVVHRDVKTANILLDERGNAFLADFGIALETVVSDGPEAALSHGSPAYAAPEQIRREPLGPEADVFSLGVVVYECLAGQLPFPDVGNAAELVRRQIDEPYPDVRSIRPEIPERVALALARATAKSPDDRYASAAEFVAALVDGSADVPATGDRPSRTAPARDVDNPYRGLRAFDETDHGDFFGRDRLVDELVGQLDGQGIAARCLTVVGPSGSGKSSVVRAGLLPAIRGGRLAGSENWFVTTMMPGANPFEALESALLRIAVDPPAALLHELCDGPRGVLRGVRRCLASETDHVLLVIDQLEELFTATPPDRARDFLDALAVLVDEPTAPVTVLATLRADYYDRPLSHRRFAPILKAGSVDVTPLAPDELELAITAPAERHGVGFDPGLVARIAAEATGQPSPLPLLQYALAELFERRAGSLLTVEAYDGIGGLAGSLAARAEQIYRSGDEAECDATRRVFGRLIDPGQTRADLRRRALRSDLGADDSTQRVLDRYGAARLLTFDRDPATREPTVEVAHEALLREWPRLVTWLAEDRTMLRAIDHLTTAADAWHEGGRSPTDLYRGARLHGANELVATASDRLRAIDREFVVASNADADAAREVERRRVRRLRRLVVGVSAALVVALVAGGIALQQQRRAEDNARAAAARGLAVQATAIADRELDTALLLAANADAADPSPTAQEGLLTVLERARLLERAGPFPGPDDVERILSSGGTMVVLHPEGVVRSYDAATDEPAGPEIDVGPEARGDWFVISGDGRRFAVESGGGVSVWDVATGDAVLTGLQPTRPDFAPWLSAAGTYLFMQTPFGDPVEVYRVADGELLGTVAIDGDPGLGLVWSAADEASVYLGRTPADSPTGFVAEFGLPSLEPLGEPVQVGVPAIIAVPSDDGTLVAATSTSPEAAVELLDAETLAPIAPSISLDAGRFGSAAWNPSSTRLAVGTLSSEFVVLASTGAVEARLVGRTGRVQGSGWIDDDRFFVVTDDHRMVWDLSKGPTLGDTVSPFPLAGVDAVGDGRYVVNDGAQLALVAPDGEQSEFVFPDDLANRCGPIHVQPVGGLAALLCLTSGPDGSSQRSFAVVDPAAGEVVSDPVVVQGGDLDGFTEFALSPDGTTLAVAGSVAGDGGPIGVVAAIDAATGEFVVPPMQLDLTSVLAVAWTPDGAELLAGGQEGDLLVVDTASWEVVDRVPIVPNGGLTDIALDTAGEVAFVSVAVGEVWMIDVESRTPVGPPLAGATSQFQSVSVSPDGSRVVAAGRDGDLRIWDVATGQVIGPNLAGGDVTVVRFLDDDTLLTWGAGPVLVWDLSDGALQATACRLAGRPLTDDEIAVQVAQMPVAIDFDAC